MRAAKKAKSHSFTALRISRQQSIILRQRVAEIENLYRHAPCGYLSLDRDGTFLDMNDTELAWLGYTRDEVVGRLKFTDARTRLRQCRMEGL